MHSRVRSGQSRWRTGSTSMSAPAATVRWQSVSWKMGRVHFGRVLSGSEEQCVCRRPLEGVLATKVFELGLVLRIAKEWQLCGGDVARHGRGHQTAQRETWELDGAIGASVEECLQWKSGKHCCTYWTI